jgi:hypothetical protein
MDAMHCNVCIILINTDLVNAVQYYDDQYDTINDTILVHSNHDPMQCLYNIDQY